MAASDSSDVAAKTLAKNPWILAVLLLGSGAGAGGWFSNMTTSGAYLKEFEKSLIGTQQDVKEMQKTLSEIKTGVELLRKDYDHIRDNALKRPDVEQIVRSLVKPDALR